MGEVRTMREGQLWWVQASGSGRSWATAATPQSGLFGFVRSMQFTSAADVVVVSDRGTPDHKKVTNLQPINGQINFAWTGWHPTGASGAGASVPMVHLEYKASQPETGSGRFFQFYGVSMNSIQFQEGQNEDTIQATFNALGMSGENPSGYIAPLG